MSSVELEQLIRRVVSESRPSDELITIAQAAALVNVGVTTIRSWLKSGTLKRYGEGRIVRVKRAQVLDVMANGSAASKSGPDLEELVRAEIDRRRG